MSARSKEPTQRGAAPGPTRDERLAATVPRTRSASPAHGAELGRDFDLERTVPRGTAAGPAAGDELARESDLAVTLPRPAGMTERAPARSPIQVISMKTPAEARDAGAVPWRAPAVASGSARDVPAQGPRTREPTPAIQRPKLRALSEVTPAQHAGAQRLGNLAPPRDASEVRARRLRDYVLWGCVAVIVASCVALAMWFIAR